MSKINAALRLASLKGYRVTELGEVINALGGVRKCQIKRNRHDLRKVFNVGLGGGVRFPVPVHKLVAFQKFGEAMFEPGIQVRHLDGNSLNNCPENIELGTQSDNAMDRPPEDRQAHSRHAASHNIAYDWAEVERDYFEHDLGFKKLAAKYGMSVGTLSHHFNRIPGWMPKVIGPDWEGIRDYLARTGCNYREVGGKFGVTERSCRRKLGPLRGHR
jgi:hypothetical protein